MEGEEVSGGGVGGQWEGRRFSGGRDLERRFDWESLEFVGRDWEWLMRLDCGCREM